MNFKKAFQRPTVERKLKHSDKCNCHKCWDEFKAKVEADKAAIAQQLSQCGGEISQPDSQLQPEQTTDHPPQ